MRGKGTPARSTRSVWASEAEKDTAQVWYATNLCEQHGIKSETVTGAVVFGHPAAIEELATRLSTVQPKGRGASTGRALVNYLCSAMVSRCAERGMPPPAALASLLSRQLSADKFAARDHKKPLAYDRAVLYFAARPKASLREIAAYAGINHNTVAEWKASGALEKEAERFEKRVPGSINAMKAFLKTHPELSGKKYSL
jgi:hypothetical protein